MCLWLLADPQWGVKNDGHAHWYPHTEVRRVRNPDVSGITGRQERSAAMWADVFEPLAEELEYGFVKKVFARRGVVV
jgi:hypothetical protein